MHLDLFCDIRLLRTSHEVDDHRLFAFASQPLGEDDIPHKLLQDGTRFLLFDPVAIQWVGLSIHVAINAEKIGYLITEPLFLTKERSVG
jgi:hypothetical protein